MFYTLEGAAKRKGLGEFTILRAIEEGRITGTKDLFGDWQVHELELRKLWGPLDENPAENGSTSDASNLDEETLEIFGPVDSEFNSERLQCSTELVPSIILPPRVAEKQEQCRLRGQPPERRNKVAATRTRQPQTRTHSASACEDEIWLDDEDKISGGPPHCETREFRKLPIRGILLLALGWAGGLISYHLFSLGFTNSKQSIASEKQIPRVGQPSGAENSGKAAAAAKSILAPGHAPRRRMTPKPDQERETTGSIKQQDRVQQEDRVVTPFPDTRPTTVSGWTLKSVTGGIAVLEGPYGTWKAARGDLVPGLGKIDSIVLWGNRWIVATTRGLVTTP
jgi:hypothetical protein